MTLLNVTEAAATTGKARRTIQRDTKSGKLSVARHDGDKKLYDPAELERVYGQLVALGAVRQKATMAQTGTPNVTADFLGKISVLEMENKKLREHMEDMRTERDHWREEFKYQRLLLTDGREKQEDKELKSMVRQLQKRFDELVLPKPPWWQFWR